MIHLYIIKKLNPLNLTRQGQYCFIKVIIKQKGDTIIKEEVMECADGRRSLMILVIGNFLRCSIITTLITQITAENIVRKTHAFKSYGEMCLKSNGKWEVK